MSLGVARPTSFKTPKPMVTQATVVPAPLNGMDARVPLAIDNQNNCLWAINMVPNEYSMRVRKGYREWQTGMTEEIRTIIPYTGTQTAGTYDRCFAVTEDGIYEVTNYASSPTLKIAFGTQSDDAGYGSYTAYVDESGDDLMYYADSENGLFHYDPTTNTWTTATGIQESADSIGTLDPADIVFVMVHKLRIWFVERNANKAWYLPIRSATGDCEEFFFGGKFKYGGELVGLYNWTVDGGLGRDDHLVAISRGGDVIPWTGEDPSDSNTWTATGTFYIGPVPKGRRIASEYGGELFVLSRFGITPISALLSGANLADPYSNNMGHKIARLLRDDLENYGAAYGWSIKLVQNIGSLIITVPIRSDGRYRQYVYNISTQGWGTWRDVPMLCCDTWNGALMFGDVSGAIHRMDQTVDGVTISGGGDDADEIDWFVLTSYDHLGSPATYKRAKLIRTNFYSEQQPEYNTVAVYDYMQEEPTVSLGAVTVPTGDVWGSGLWGDAVWSMQTLEPFHKLLGASGIGRSIAIALIGKSTVETDLVSFDVMWDAGGML